MIWTIRLYLLRAVYLLVTLFLVSEIWPAVIRHSGEPAIMPNVARCLMAAMAPLMLLGIRYPLKMLPIMVFEFLWKTIWIAAFGIPLWLHHQVTPDILESIKACGMGVVLCPIVIPWGYAWKALTGRTADPSPAAPLSHHVEMA